MAVVINTVDTNYFTLNGTRYAKIYVPLKGVISTEIGIYNSFDTCQQILASTPFSEFTVDAVTGWLDEDALMTALLPVIYKYASVGGGGIGTIDWGNIGGLLSNQTDLDVALSNKSAVGHTHTFASLTSKPTTLSGFGITDAYTKTEVNSLLSAKADSSHTHLVANITDFASNLAGTTNTTVFTPTLDYHVATKKYVDDNSGGASTLPDLTDVTITAATAFDFLMHNGTAWVDRNIDNLGSQDGLQSYDIVDLNTIDVTGQSVFYRPVSSGSANVPDGVNDGYLLHIANGDIGGNARGAQIAVRRTGGAGFYFRKMDDKIWHRLVDSDGDTMTGGLIIDDGATQADIDLQNGFFTARRDGQTGRMIVGTSSTDGNYLFGGNSTGGAGFESYLRVSTTLLQYTNPTGTYDIWHTGNLPATVETWTVVNNSSSPANEWVKVANITGGAAERYRITLTGASGYSSSGTFPDENTTGAVDLYITVGNGGSTTDNVLVTAYRNSHPLENVITEVKTLKIATSDYEIWVKVATFATLLGTIHATDGATYTLHTDIEQATEPVGTIAKPIFDVIHSSKYNITVEGEDAPVSWVLSSKDDVTLHLKSDTDNVTETHNPTLILSQDGELKSLTVSLASAANDGITGTASNDVYFKTNSATEDFHFGNSVSTLKIDNGANELAFRSWSLTGSGSSMRLADGEAVSTSLLGIINSNGYIEVGCNNTSYAHFYTDRPLFYFQKGVNVDTGVVRSHNENLYLSRQGSTTERIEIAAGVTYSHQDMEIDNHLLKNAVGRSGLMSMNYNASAAWYGLQIIDKDSGQLWNLMGDDNNLGLYDDTNNEWIALYTENAGLVLYYNGAAKLQTTSGGTTTTGDCTATDHNATSDGRLKTDIRALGDYKITTNWVKYKWKDGGKEDIGLVAQDLELTNPEFVKHDDKGVKSISYTKVLIAKMAEKDRQVEELQDRVDRLEFLVKQLLG